MTHKTEYRLTKPDLPSSQIADIVRNAVSVAVAPFYKGDGFRPDLVAMTNCVKFGVHNGDGTYQPNIELENTFHIKYGTKAVGHLVVDEQIVIGFYGEAPLSRFELKRGLDTFEVVPKDRECIEQAILRELADLGLVQISDTDSMPLPP